MHQPRVAGHLGSSWRIEIPISTTGHRLERLLFFHKANHFSTLDLEMLDVPRQGELGFNFDVENPGLKDAPEFSAEVRRFAKSKANHPYFQNILLTFQMKDL